MDGQRRRMDDVRRRHGAGFNHSQMGSTTAKQVQTQREGREGFDDDQTGSTTTRGVRHRQSGFDNGQMDLTIPALDATFMYQYQDLPKSYHQSTPGIPHHPKKPSLAVVPGLVRISNKDF